MVYYGSIVSVSLLDNVVTCVDVNMCTLTY